MSDDDNGLYDENECSLCHVKLGVGKENRIQKEFTYEEEKDGQLVKEKKFLWCCADENACYLREQKIDGNVLLSEEEKNELRELFSKKE